MMNNSELQMLADMISANISLNTKEVLTADEAAKYMGVSKSTLYKMTMKRVVPFCKPNGKLCFFNRAELEQWLLRNRVATADEISDRAQAYCGKKGGKL